MRLVKRYRWWLVLLLILVCVGLSLLRWQTYTSGASFVNYCKIRRGMTPTQAEQILGKNFAVCGFPSDRLDVWEVSEGPRPMVILIHYDPSGRADARRFGFYGGPNTWLKQIEEYLGQRWSF